MSEIFGNLSVNSLRYLLSNAKDKIILIKFTAKWCGPCRITAPVVESLFASLPDNVIIFELDIDDPNNKPLYNTLKTKRMINGIPSFVAYYGNLNHDFWYVPDVKFSGGNITMISNFFSTVRDYAENVTSLNI